jgi:D-aminopeptidase
MRKRTREIGVDIGSLDPGVNNAITDVKGVGVGHTTIIEGNEIRTGVTAITPHSGNIYEEKVTAAVDVLNGYGKSVGLTQINFEGNIETPVLLTETLNTFQVANAVIDYVVEGYEITPKTVNPVVGETNGSFLTNNLRRVVGDKEVFHAIDVARKHHGKVDEGNVGAGTPMTGYGFKGGIGTSSRKVGDANIGVLVQLNCGRKEDLLVNGVPVGREIELETLSEQSAGNSIMMIVATDIEMESRQLWKMAKRTALGLSRTGSYSGNTSGDFTIAFTTGNHSQEDFMKSIDNTAKGEGWLNPVYKATVEATEEAIINALLMAETMTGYKGNTRYELPIDQTKEILYKYNMI